MSRAGQSRLSASARGLGRLLAALGLLLVFVLAAVLGVLLHLDLPAGRRLVAATLTTLLSRTFKGELSVGRIDRAGLNGVVAADFVVTDRYGQVVLRANRVRARANLPALLEEVLLGGSRLDLGVRNVRIERVDVYVLPDPTTDIPTIAEAFTPEPSAPEPSTTPKQAGRRLRVWLPTVEIGRIWGRVVIGKSGPTLEATLQNTRGSVLVTPEGTAIDVDRFGMLVRGLGGADAKGTGEFHLRASEVGTELWSSFNGFFGDVQAQAGFRLLPNGEMKLSASVPRALPDQVRALWLGWPLVQPATVHAEASGRAPTLDVAVRGLVDGVSGAPPASVNAKGTLTLSPDLALSLRATGSDVDLRALGADLPETALDLRSRIEIWNREGELVVDLNGASRPTQIAGEDVPAIDVTGTYTPKAGLVATATLHEPRMPVKLDLRLQPNGDLAATARARSFQIEQVPRLRRYIDARGTVDLEVDAHLEKGRLQATAKADVQRFQTGDLGLATGRVTATVDGPANQPRRLNLRATLTGTRGRAGQLAFEKVSARAEGPVTRPRLTATLEDGVGPSVRATGTAVLEGQPRFEELQASVARGATEVQVSLDRVAVGKGAIRLDDLELRGGAGDLRGSVHIGDDDLAINLSGQGVDLAKLCELLGLPRGMLAGKLDINAKITGRGEDQQGKLFASLKDGALYSVTGLSADLDTQLERDSLKGGLQGELAGIGEFGAAWDTRIGPVVKVESWRDILGMLRVELKNVELAPLALLLPASARIQEISGRAYAHLRFERRVRQALPTVFVVAGTQSLRVARSPADLAEEPMVFAGIDVQVGGDVSGETGALNAVARLVDHRGVLAASSAAARLELHRLVHDARSRDETLANTEIEAVLTVPNRSVSDLPTALQPTAFEGVVGGRVALSGRVSSPTVTGEAHVTGLKSQTSRYVVPVDLGARVQFDTETGEFGASAEAKRQNERLAVLVLKGTREEPSPEAVKPTWTGGGQLSLTGLPLSIFPPLAESQISGKLYGSIGMQRAEQEPSITANVEVQNLAVDTLPIGAGRLLVSSVGKQLSADVHFRQEGGKLDSKAALGLRWDGVVPSVDETVPVRIAVDAESYNAAILRPLVTDVFSQLGGTIHAELAATIYKQADPEFPELQDWTGELAGDLVLQDGTIELTALGLELDDVTLSANASSTGKRTRITVTQLDAKARSDEVNLRARADLELAGFRLERASATATMREVPLLIQGVPQANASGQALMKLERKPNEVDVSLELENMTAKLPRSTGRSLVELSENEDIVVLQPLREPTTPRDSAGRVLPWRIRFDLAEKVRVVRNDMDVPLGGSPTLLLGEELEISGELALKPGGRVQLMGKSFVIESGRIRFVNEDPADPTLVVTASWQAPAHLVFVEVRGTVKDPVITFRSDPPLSQAEVVALVLGGGGDAGAAAAVGRGVGASLFNELFSDTPLGTIEIRTAETESGVGKYTAAIQISDKVWFEANYYEPQKERSNSPDANQQPLGVSGTVDWRFHRNWSLRTELGDIGAGADLLWQYRY